MRALQSHSQISWPIHFLYNHALILPRNANMKELTIITPSWNFLEATKKNFLITKNLKNSSSNITSREFFSSSDSDFDGQENSVKFVKFLDRIAKAWSRWFRTFEVFGKKNQKKFHGILFAQLRVLKGRISWWQPSNSEKSSNDITFGNDSYK